MTVRDLLNDAVLTGHRLIGGADGLTHVIRDAALVSTDELNRLPSGAVAVMDISTTRGLSRQHLVEQVLLRVHHRGGRMLIVVGNLEDPPQSIIRLADRLNLPVVAVQGPSPAAVAAHVMAVAQQPELAYARVLGIAARKLTTADSIDRILSIVGGVLHASVALVAADGAVIAGGLLHLRPETIDWSSGAIIDSVPSHVLAALPIHGADGQMWLACEAAHGGPAWQDTARTLLQVATLAVAAWLARQRLAAERDRTRLHGMFTELLQLDPRQGVPEPLAAQAATLGVALDGWHVGLHLTWHRDSLPDSNGQATATLTRALATEELDTALITRADGWSLWKTSATRSTSADIDHLVDQLRRCICYYNAAGHTPLVGGVGQPAAGPSAIPETVHQAQRAARAIATTGQPGAVSFVGDLGAHHLLAQVYGEPAFRAYAQQLLAPVLKAPDSAALLLTLTAYLGNSCSPTQTAKAICVHRNTVAERIARIEHLLTTPLKKTDQLALQLACRSLSPATDVAGP
ncbi:helix-turn-helix domain-containing protein [Sphaerisporangium flaviroseum]|uniref:PucR family transcriptional regulator n=1 Tax=Sphaerisporangium flaviroseum TaxID=509199 RepID=UPI0031EF1F63